MIRGFGVMDFVSEFFPDHFLPVHAQICYVFKKNNFYMYIYFSIPYVLYF